MSILARPLGSEFKIHPPILRGAESALKSIFLEGRHADKVVDWTLRHERKWGSRDRRAFAEVVFETVRWWRRLLWTAEVDETSPIDESWCRRALSAFLTLRGGEGPAFESIRERWAKPPTLAIEQSVPDWLYELGRQELGAHWPETLRILNTQAPVFLRANSLKARAEQVAEELRSEKIAVEQVDDLPWGLRLTERANVFRTKSFLSGHFEVQDGGSQKIAPFLAVQPGERVIDACAGAGGKSLHLSALMNNQGRLVAMDVHEKKLAELKLRARRAGVSNLEIRKIESAKTIKRLQHSADRLLLDVPCSGLGVLRRQPDQKWKLTPEKLSELRGVQAEILKDYSKMVRPGGVMVYATCSLLPSENQFQVAAFLEAHPKWCLDAQIHIPPSEGGYDGFYAARMIVTKS